MLSCDKDSPTIVDPPPNPDIVWIKTANPMGGAVLSLAVDSSGNLFAGTEGGGVFKSPDKGNTWTPFNNGLSGMAVYDLTVTANDLIYAAANQQGLFRSSVDSVKQKR